MNRSAKYIITFALTILIVSSCSTTKHLPEDEVLYLGTRSLQLRAAPDGEEKMKVKEKPNLSQSIFNTLWLKPNGALLGMPFIRGFPWRLYFYNLFYTEEDSTFNRWMMDNFGEPPITLSEANPEARVEYMENYLFNRGFFGVSGDYSIQYKKNSDGRKAWVRYKFIIPDVYRYRNINTRLDPGQPELQEEVGEYMEQSLVKPGNPFNLDEIATEKQHLWEHLQNKGYYYLEKNHIVILADTTAGDHQVDLEYRILPDNPAKTFRKVYFDKSEVLINSVSLVPSDSGKTSVGKDLKIRNLLMEKSINIEEDSLYSLDKAKATVRDLTSLGVFSEPLINYRIHPEDSLKIDPLLEMQTQNLFSIGANVNVTMKNSGYIGPNFGLSATRKNLFGGAENLTVMLDAYTDFPFGALSSRTSRSSGVKTRAILRTPVLKSPLSNFRHAIGLPERSISVGLDFNNRTIYFTMAQFTGSYGIQWRRSAYVTHKFNLANLSYSILLDSTSLFNDLLSQSSLLRNSYKDRFILGPSYTFTYNNTQDKFRKFRIYFEGEAEISGNLLNAGYRLSGNTRTGQRFLGVEFSQFARFQTDFRFYYRLGEKNTYLVFRNLLGAGLAYGNSLSMPYTKQFFIGGSNSLRPIAARVIGPGTYLEFDRTAYNQMGDLKFETNLELRFKIWYIFHGAFWADYGNIWLIEEDPQRPGTGIDWKNFYKQSYLTAGTGLRIDLDFLVLRADFGGLMYIPSLPDGYNWLFELPKDFRKLDLFNLVFGIGYPF